MNNEIRSRRIVAGIAALTVATAGLLTAPLPAANAADAGVVSEYPIETPSSAPLGMTTGPDGNLWFTETVGKKIGKMTPSGVLLAEYDVPGDHPYPIGIVAGADGNLWFADAGEARIGRMTVNGTFTGFPVAGAEPAGIAAGPDGNIWFTDFTDNNIGKMSTTGGAVVQYTITSPALEVVAGPDGNMWFTEGDANLIGKMSVSGTVLGEYAAPTLSSKPAGIIAGVDGNMWFTEEVGNKVAKSTVDGSITEYSVPTSASEPSRIVAGSDGNMWFTELAANKVAKVSTGGEFTEYPIPTTDSHPGGTTPGPDGNIWFTEAAGNQVARVTVGPPVPAVSSRSVNSAMVSATVYPGAATGTSVVQCATNSTFTVGLVQDQTPTGSPSSSSAGVRVRGACTGLRINTNYFARIKTVYTEPVGGSAPTNALYTTTARFRTKAKQIPLRNCVMIPPASGPNAIAPNSITRLTKRNCRTNAGQAVVVRGQSFLRGDVRLPKIFRMNGSWWLRTYETPARTLIVWSAPATNAFAPYRRAVVRNT